MVCGMVWCVMVYECVMVYGVLWYNGRVMVYGVLWYMVCYGIWVYGVVWYMVWYGIEWYGVWHIIMVHFHYICIYTHRNN